MWITDFYTISTVVQKEKGVIMGPKSYLHKLGVFLIQKCMSVI